MAFKMAARAAGLLIQARIPVFSPIAHSFPIAMHCQMDAQDHDVWLPADQPLIDAAHGIIVLRDGGWEESYGVGYEINEFKKAEKPVIFMDPGVVPVELLSWRGVTPEAPRLPAAAKAIINWCAAENVPLEDTDDEVEIPLGLLFDLRQAISGRERGAW